MPNFLLPIMDSIDTMIGFALGTSIPMVPLPGIGAMILIPNAARLNAISSSRCLILFILIPAAGVISNSVIVGPTVAVIDVISIPKFLNVWMILFLLASCSLSSTDGALFS